jgi:hypothetical protein
LIDNPAEQFRKQVEGVLEKGNGPKAARFAFACLRVIPGVGGAIAGVAAAWSEKEQPQYNRILAARLKLQEDEVREIWLTVFKVMARLDQNDERIRERIESPD